MSSRPYRRIFFAFSSLAFAVTLMACGSKQGANASSQSHASTRTSGDIPSLEGDEVKVCGELKNNGVVAAKQSVRGGAAFDIASNNDDVLDSLRDTANETTDARQKLEDALKEVKASKHDDGNGIYVRFVHDDEDVLNAVKDILQHGVNQNPQARKRVDIKKEDGHIIMQLPNGGALISSKTDSAANETVEKWTDRTPAKLSYEETDQGARVTVETDDDRIDEIQKNVIEPMLGCD